MKFLIVDDDVSLLKLMAALLEHAGHTVHMSHAARSAIIDSTELDFDYLITDLDMLGMSGQQLVEELQSEIGLDISQVIIVSGSADQDEIDDLLSKRIAAFIQKPINPETFASEIGAIVA